MKNSRILVLSILSSIGVFIYVVVVAWIMYNGKKLFGTANNFLAPVAFLLLFVLSAAIVGLLVLGRPIILYLNNNKREGLLMLFCTIGCLFVITASVLVLLAFI